MSEERDVDVWEDPDVILERPEATGIVRVDAVIDAIAGVGAGSLEEQAHVYEQAHVELRGVLDDPDAATA